MTFVANFRPEALWQHFDRILTIPRGSKSEERIREHVISIAEGAGLEFQIDPIGNVVVRKPGSNGREGAPTTILQAHLDMVNEKNSDVEHDFDVDPIVPRQDGEYLTASGTTLGSDNGIGVAAMLAIMEDGELAHGPLEFLFTIDEETGLTGAQNLAGDLLEGRRLINLDSEEEGTLCVGCAGGADSGLSLGLSSVAPAEGSVALDIGVSGLKGGHSGVDVHLQRGNAIKLLSRALLAASLGHEFVLADLRGGNMHNAIPREAHATVVCSSSSADAIRASIETELAACADEFRPAEPGMSFSIDGADAPATAWDAETTSRVLALVNALPHGVLSMSYDIPGLVETSTNLATVKASGDTLEIGISNRSSVASALTALRQRIRGTASLAGADVEQDNGYPGWKPDMDSTLLEVVRGLHEEVLGTEPEVGAVHAGLECGIIGEKCPGMDMISFGPQIEFPHSPDERVKVDSVERFYDLLTATLDRLSTA